MCGRDCPRSQEAFDHTLDREHGLHLAKVSGKQSCAGPRDHSPLEGESARGGARSRAGGGQTRQSRAASRAQPKRRPVRSPGASRARSVSAYQRHGQPRVDGARRGARFTITLNTYRAPARGFQKAAKRRPHLAVGASPGLVPVERRMPRQHLAVGVSPWKRASPPPSRVGGDSTYPYIALRASPLTLQTPPFCKPGGWP